MNDLPLRVATLAAAICLALSGRAGVVAAGMVAAGFLLAPWGRRLRDWTSAHLFAIVGAGVLAASSGVVPAFSLLLGWLGGHRAATASGRTDRLVLLLLATLMALIGAVGTLSLGMAPALVTFAIAAPIAMMRVHGVHDRALSVGTSIATGVLAVGFFVLVPRLQGGLMASGNPPSSRDRFADDVALGDELDDPDRDALVMRVRAWTADGVAVHSPLYLRGQTFDTFDGHAWHDSGQGTLKSTGAWTVRSRVELEPLEGSTVFAPTDLLFARTDQGPILTGPSGALSHTTPGRRTAYDAFSRVRSLEDVELVHPGDPGLPELDPRVVAFAEGVAPSSSGPELVVAGAVRALSGFNYELHPPPPGPDPLAWFLLESKAGHCEYFATALAVILRERGLQVRLATGFYAAEPAAGGAYTPVRRGHAHAWVEVAVRGGWAVVDATPLGGLPAVSVPWWQDAAERAESAWLDLVLDYDLDLQFSAAAALGEQFVGPVPGDPERERGEHGLAGAGAVLVALMASGTAVRLLLRWLASPKRQATETDRHLREFAKARRKLVSSGWRVPAELPPAAAGDWLVQQAGEAGAPLRELAWALYRARYANTPVDPAHWRDQLAALRRLPRPPGPG